MLFKTRDRQGIISQYSLSLRRQCQRCRCRISYLFICGKQANKRI